MSIDRAHGDGRRWRAGFVDDLPSDRRRRPNQNNDVGLLLGDAEPDAHRRARVSRTFARGQLVRTGPPPGESKLAIAVGLRDTLVRLGEFEGGDVAPRAHGGTGDGLLRLNVANYALEDASRHKREVRRRSAQTEIHIARLRRVLGMARRDQE
jgi:hypothetical protein